MMRSNCAQQSSNRSQIGRVGSGLALQFFHIWCRWMWACSRATCIELMFSGTALTLATCYFYLVFVVHAFDMLVGWSRSVFFCPPFAIIITRYFLNFFVNVKTQRLKPTAYSFQIWRTGQVLYVLLPWKSSALILSSSAYQILLNSPRRRAVYIAIKSSQNCTVWFELCVVGVLCGK